MDYMSGKNNSLLGFVGAAALGSTMMLAADIIKPTRPALERELYPYLVSITLLVIIVLFVPKRAQSVREYVSANVLPLLYPVLDG
jgi:hypothetical protein